MFTLLEYSHKANLNQMHHRNFSRLLVVLLLSVMIFSCRDSDRDLDDEIISSRDVLVADNLYSDVFLQIHKLAISDTILTDTGLVSLVDIPCVDTFFLTNLSGFPTDLVIDFGASNGAACADGRFRKGRIIATFSGKYTNSLTNIAVTLDNYSVDEVALTGQVNFAGLGNNGGGLRQFSMTVVEGALNGMLRGGDKIEMSYETTQTRVWMEGNGTTTIADDVFNTANGIASGRSTNGNAFTVNVSEPIRRELDCGYAVSGMFTVKPPNLQTRFVNYGTGTCDNAITVTIQNREIASLIPGFAQ